MKENKYIWAFIAFLMFLGIYIWIDFLTKNYYVFLEHFANATSNQTQTYTVNLPLTTKTSCSNFCSPATARCSKTGTQCFADLDCYGCQSPQTNNSSTTREIPGDNDAGKLTTGNTPQYSTLTTNPLVENATQFLSWDTPPNSYPEIQGYQPTMQFAQKMFDDRYKIKDGSIPFMFDYKKRKTLSGEFTTDEAYPSNY